jgi:hypothetical protein
MALRGHRCFAEQGWSAVPVLIHREPLSPATRNAAAASVTRRVSMLDIIVLALGLGFFVVAVGYTYACERL